MLTGGFCFCFSFSSWITSARGGDHRVELYKVSGCTLSRRLHWCSQTCTGLKTAHYSPLPPGREPLGLLAPFCHTHPTPRGVCKHWARFTTLKNIWKVFYLLLPVSSNQTNQLLCQEYVQNSLWGEKKKKKLYLITATIWLIILVHWLKVLLESIVSYVTSLCIVTVVTQCIPKCPQRAIIIFASSFQRDLRLCFSSGFSFRFFLLVIGVSVGICKDLLQCSYLCKIPCSNIFFFNSGHSENAIRKFQRGRWSFF